jgi:hypothetical protein
MRNHLIESSTSLSRWPETPLVSFGLIRLIAFMCAAQLTEQATRILAR